MKIAGNSITPCGATKLVQLPEHPGVPARSGDDHAEQQTVERQHQYRSEPAGDSERKRGERDRQIVGHDVARLQRLHVTIECVHI